MFLDVMMELMLIALMSVKNVILNTVKYVMTIKVVMFVKLLRYYLIMNVSANAQKAILLTLKEFVLNVKRINVENVKILI